MLQTIGLRPSRVFRIIVGESMLVCAVGGFIGTATALSILAFAGLAVGAEGVTIAFRPTANLAFNGALD